MGQSVRTVLSISGLFVGAFLLSFVFIKPADMSVLVHEISSPSSHALKTLDQFGFTDQKPQAWHGAALLPMQQANYIVPAAGVAADNLFLYAQASITILAGDAGGISANVNRWYRQLGREEQSEETLKKQALPVKSDAGEWQLFKLSDPKVEKAIYGAILKAPEKTIFVKIQGPAQTLSDNSEAYISWLLTVKPLISVEGREGE